MEIPYMKEEKSGFSRDFLLVVIGQIISLFGNAVLRFALPLHLLDVTGSAALLGIVSGCAFIPLAVMSPIGGLIADRVNKRNIMVTLDFFTAGLVLLFTVLYGKLNLVAMILILMFLLFGISGAYQPSVQSSIPLLVSEDNIMTANAIVNMVSSLSGLLGPALGGIVYNIWGIQRLLYICIICFGISAVMEIFIRIPFTKRDNSASFIKEAGKDLEESVAFICRERAEVGKLTLCCACINLVLSALIIIGYPVIVMQVLKFPENNPSEMYGFIQALLAVGGLAGGLGAGIFGSKLDVRGSWKVFFISGLLIFPMGAALMIDVPVYIAYAILAVSGMLLMAFASIYTILVMSYIQIVTPRELTGKVIAWVIAISTCAQPIGQIIYGFLFEKMTGYLWPIFYAAALICVVIAFYNRNIAKQLN